MAEIKEFMHSDKKELIKINGDLTESLNEFEALNARLKLKIDNGATQTEAEIDQLLTLMAQVSRDSSEIADWLHKKGKTCPTDSVDYVKIAKEEKGKVYGLKIVK